MSEPVTITDHALVRWLERTGALDAAQLRHLIAGSLKRATDAADALGVAHYTIVADGLVYLMRDGALVHVVEENHGNRIWPHRPQAGD